MATFSRVTSKPWGAETLLLSGQRLVMKRLVVQPRQRLSLQMHGHKEEVWYVVAGFGMAVLGEERVDLWPGSLLLIQPGQVHRLAAYDVPLEVIEVSTPELDDVMRLADDYGRESLR